MSNDLVTVYRANTLGEADVVAAWLDEQGVPAFVKNAHSATLYVSVVAAPLGIEVCVAEENADAARDLLAKKQAERPDPPDPEAPWIEAECEDCGGESLFPPSAAGTVQSCPHCRANLDVPEA